MINDNKTQKLYIDIGTKTGLASLNYDNEIVSWNVDLSKERYIKTYASSSCTKKEKGRSSWDENKQKWCLIKMKKVIHINTISQQLKKFQDILIDGFNNDYKFIIEEPHTTGNFSSRKTLALFGIADLTLDNGYKEIKETIWFKWITDKLPKFKVWNNGVNTKKVNRKKTSMEIASFLLGKEIKDDNEADAICMLFYDNQELFEIHKLKGENNDKI